MLLLPLGGCDVVLGIQWLATLGTVKWNFMSLKMEFTHNGRHYVLGGLKAGKVQMVSPKKLAKALMVAVWVLT